MIDDLTGEIVDLMANDVIYTGRLVEMGETEVYLETESGCLTIPVEQIAFIRKKEQKGGC